MAAYLRFKLLATSRFLELWRPLDCLGDIAGRFMLPEGKCMPSTCQACGACLCANAGQETWASREQHLKRLDLLLTARQVILLALVLVRDALQNSVCWVQLRVVLSCQAQMGCCNATHGFVS